ncbi:MAG: Uma2 family endonuclease [Pirellulales bacterium]|nr:Uma2 family endonuclease [Pirellulales bacterium]
MASLSDFRKWTQSLDFPKIGRFDFLAGQVEVDLSPEDFFFHAVIKTSVAAAIFSRVADLGSGHVCTDRTRVTCVEAMLSVEPDVLYVSDKSIDSGKVKLIPKSGEEAERFVELEGPPDLVVEIVSDSSEMKDTQRLPQAYFSAGVKELWIIDARHQSIKFQIFKLARRKYLESLPDESGYRHSPVLQCDFHLERKRNASGRYVYKLHER